MNRRPRPDAESRSKTGAGGPAPEFEPGLLGRLGERVGARLAAGPCLLLTDRVVARLYGNAAEASLRSAGFAPRLVRLPSGERHKNLDAAQAVWKALASMDAHRNTPLVALGGGVITDLGGFAAAVYARGIPWFAVPTTVLAMADAAVGGKTAVDLPQGKNLVGAFHPPVGVLADPDVLQTLPLRHVRNGLAEVAKMHFIAGVRRGLPEVHALAAAVDRPTDRGIAIREAALRKHRMVTRDPRETLGVRILLNLGHTVGHALEAATKYDGTILHGEAVAIGIVVACRISEGRGHLQAGEPERVAEALTALGLPVALPKGTTGNALLRYMNRDKKRSRQALRMVLPRTAGQAVEEEVAQAELARAL